LPLVPEPFRTFILISSREKVGVGDGVGGRGEGETCTTFFDFGRLGKAIRIFDLLISENKPKERMNEAIKRRSSFGIAIDGKGEKANFGFDLTVWAAKILVMNLRLRGEKLLFSIEKTNAPKHISKSRIDKG